MLRSRYLWPLALCVTLPVGTVSPGEEQTKTSGATAGTKKTTGRMLPGVQPGGSVLLPKHQEIRIVKVSERFVVGGMATDTKGTTLYVAGPWGNAVGIVPLDRPHQKTTVSFAKVTFPYTCLAEPTGKRLFVSLWGDAS